MNDLAAVHGLHTADTAAAGVDVADDIAHVLFGNGNIDTHDRFKKSHRTLLHSFLHSHGTGDMEGHFRRIDFMIRTVIQLSLKADYRITGQHAGLHRFLDTLVNSGNVLFRYSTADDGVDELVGLFTVRIRRIEADFTITVLTFTTGLTNELTLYIAGFGKSFLIGNLRCADISLYVEFTQQTVNDDLKMQLAHTFDDGLSAVLIRMSTEGRIFLGKFCQSDTHLFLTSLGLRFDRDRDNGIREFHRLEDDRMVLIAKGITGGSVFKSYRSGDIAGINFFQLLALVSVHQKDTSKTLLLVFGRVQNIRTGFGGSGINTEISQFTNERIGHDLEGKSSERLTVIRFTMILGSAVQQSTLDRRDIQR